MRVFKHRQKRKDGAWVPTKTWYISFRDHRDRKLLVAGLRDKRATEDLGRLIEGLVTFRATGGALDTATHERVRKLSPKYLTRLIELDLLDGAHAERLKSIGDHIADFIASLRNKHRAAKHVSLVETRLRRLVGLCKCTELTTLSPAGVQQVLSGLIQEGCSAQTANHYLTALKQFANWMFAQGRAPHLSFGAVSRYNVKTDPRHQRRALSEAECQTLLVTAARGPVRFRMSGRDRALLYLVAVSTGLRANELRQLKVADFHQAEGTHFLAVKAAAAKNRRPARQPIPDEIAKMLANYVAGKAPDSRLFAMPESDHTAKMLRQDLEDAGISYCNPEGLYADFHALRHTFVTRLVGAGVDPKAIQLLARHSTPMLTLGLYSHRTMGELISAVTSVDSFADCVAEPVNHVTETLGGDAL